MFAAPAAPRIRRQAALSLLVAVGVGALMWRLPAVAGTTWAAVAACLGALPVVVLGQLAVVWFIGIYCYTWVLTASLPGLSHRRALILNLGGSLVANLVPFGGAAGAALNLAMARSWNVSTARFATFATVSNLWNVVVKLGLPAVALTILLAGGTLQSPRLVLTAVVALVTVALIAGLAGAALGSARLAASVGALADRAGARLLAAYGSSRRTTLAVRLPAARAEIRDVARNGWRQLTAAMVGYVVLQGVLWWMCLHSLDNHLAPEVVLAGFAVERALSMLPFSPGGVGFAEAGSIAVLTSLGGDPLTVTAAVLLFRVFAFVIEIPVGSIALAAWFWSRRSAARAAATNSGAVTA